jgi:hypothetical protein
MHDAMQGADADRNLALTRDEGLQVAQTPDRDWQPIGLRPLVERRAQPDLLGLIQFDRPTATGAID